MDFAQKELGEFVSCSTNNVANNAVSSVAHSEVLNTFEASLRSLLENASKDSSEEFQKNLIAEFLRKSFGYDCNVRGKADLAIYDEGKAKVLFEVKSTQNKAEFVKATHPLTLSAEGGGTLESKAFYESILYFLREVHSHKNNNLKHIILCTAREFYIIKAQDYHALFVKNADKAIQKRIDSAYKNCDLKQGNDTSTARFYTEIESIVRDMGDRLEFIYVNVPTILGEAILGENVSDSRATTRERERERETARVCK